MTGCDRYIKNSFLDRHIGTILTGGLVFYAMVIYTIIGINLIDMGAGVSANVMNPINITGIVLVSVGFMANIGLSFWLARREHNTTGNIFSWLKNGFVNGVQSFYFLVGGTLVFLLSLIVLVRCLSDQKGILTVIMMIVLIIVLYFYFSFAYQVENRVVHSFYSSFLTKCMPKRSAKKESQLFVSTTTKTRKKCQQQ